MTTTTAAPAIPVDLGSGPFGVRTQDLVKRYGAIPALDRLALHVPEQAVYVLVGPNGAGKTTLLRLLMNLLRADAGEIRVLGRDPRLDGPGIRGRVGYVPEGHELGYPWMTVGRLLDHHRVYYPTWDAAYADRLVKAYEVDRSRKCRQLSKGQRRRVQLILALAHRPPLLLLDEPTDGLDHVVRDETLAILSEHLADTPTTALISTHRVYEIERLVDHVGVLSKGRLLGQLAITDLQRGLLRYWADIPPGWQPPPGLDGQVVRASGSAQDIEWTVWGEKDRVTGELARTGATVREVAPLSVDEAATALLSRKEELSWRG